ncbi:MAG: 1-deoxy-D-xylulose-5-phosphate synthase [Armatimonadia bacterium]|nr:1-deoxy-D-xylulose-5-phosphate synthase [Armatimonadia bacterium]
MGELLNRVNSPRDLKDLPRGQLGDLAEEVRQFLIDSVSRTGGHLAPNLGIVELTLALHRIFDSPADKIVWDVGHQCYVHKLLTGRRDRFSSLRQTGGLSGFPRRDESEHDAFGAGHGSTSISAALGMAVARDRRGGNNKVIAVIGDGAMTGGLAMEGLNQAGHIGSDLIVVLNDNGMSISPNVGGVARSFHRLRYDPGYRRAKEHVKGLVSQYDRLGVGSAMMEMLGRVKDGARHLVVPGTLFEAFGLEYIGPVDGHDIEELLRTFDLVRDLPGPILVHVHTQKGKGYSPAESNAERFHGIQPFDVETGETAASSGSGKPYTEVFADALMELAAEDERIVAITAAMAPGTGLLKFAETYPGRFFDVGMAEQHAVTFAAGLAAEGLRPVVAIYSTFLQRAYDEVIHDVCLQGLPVTFCMDRAGIVGADGPTHHGVFDLSYMRHFPELLLMAPSDELQLRDMLLTAIRHGGPAAIRYPRSASQGLAIDRPMEPLPTGAAVVRREGKDCTLVTIGSLLHEALRAAEILAGHELEAEVIDARFAKPIDLNTIRRSVEKTGVLVTAEENALQGGFGSGVLEMLEAAHVNGLIAHRLGLPDIFVEHGETKGLRRRFGLDARSIADVVLAHMPNRV